MTSWSACSARFATSSRFGRLPVPHDALPRRPQRAHRGEVLRERRGGPQRHPRRPRQRFAARGARTGNEVAALRRVGAHLEQRGERRERRAAERGVVQRDAAVAQARACRGPRAGAARRRGPPLLAIATPRRPPRPRRRRRRRPSAPRTPPRPWARPRARPAARARGRAGRARSLARSSFEREKPGLLLRAAAAASSSASLGAGAPSPYSLATAAATLRRELRGGEQLVEVLIAQVLDGPTGGGPPARAGSPPRSRGRPAAATQLARVGPAVELDRHSVAASRWVVAARVEAQRSADVSVA